MLFLKLFMNWRSSDSIKDARIVNAMQTFLNLLITLNDFSVD